MGVSLEEQETVIQFNRTDEHATVYTSDSTMMTKLDRLCKSSPKFYKKTREEKDREGHIVGKCYSVANKSLVSLRTKKVEKNLSEEERQILSDRAKSNFKKNSVSLDKTTDTEF